MIVQMDALRDWLKEQETVAGENRADFVPTKLNEIVGLSRGFDVTCLPLNGLRHPKSGRTSGWYIWSGQYSEEDDFFEPVHALHLEKSAPELLRLLGLGPGWRFLVAGEHVDMWYDKALVEI